MSIPRFNQIDPSTIVVKEDSNTDYGVLVRLVHGPNREPIRFQSPLTRLAWAPQVRDKLNPAQPSCVLSLSLDPAVDEFHAWLDAVDARLKELVVSRSKELLGKDYEMVFIDGMYNNLVKTAKETKWSDTFCPRVALKKDPETNNWSMNLKTFTANKLPGKPEDLLTKNSEVVAVVQIAYLFCNKSTKSITVRSDVDQVVCIPAAAQEDCVVDISSEPRMVAAAAAADEAVKRTFDAIVGEVGAGGEEGEVTKKSKIEYTEDGDDV